MRKQFQHDLLDSQMPNGPVAKELGAIMDNINEFIGEALTRAEGTNMAESTASLVISREKSMSETNSKRQREDVGNPSREWHTDIEIFKCGGKGHLTRNCAGENERGATHDGQESEGTSNHSMELATTNPRPKTMDQKTNP